MGVNIKNKNRIDRKPSRKQIRKQKRNQKKLKREAYFSKKRLNSTPIEGNKAKEVVESHPRNESINQKNQSKANDKRSHPLLHSPSSTIESECKKEKRKQKQLMQDMVKQRKEQLMKANEKEDQVLKKLEKQLKLNKKKSKSIPKSFVTDGLSYMLEAADLKNSKDMVSVEQDLNDVNNEFEEDFALMTGGKPRESQSGEVTKDNESDFEDMLNEDYSSDENEQSDEDIPNFSFNDDSDDNSNARGKTKRIKGKNEPNKKFKSNDIGESDDVFSDASESHSEGKDLEHFDGDSGEQDTWEDIYGRLRSKDGGVVNTANKYIPPAIRAKMECGSSEDKKRKEKLDRLRKQLKGLLNRLAESNMHNIASQIENLYMNNSRNDMSETLTSLIIESLVSNVSTPERLLMEHILLIAILHANVGTEVGTHFLQNIAEQLNNLVNNPQNIEDKTLDNVVGILGAHFLQNVTEQFNSLVNKPQNIEDKTLDNVVGILGQMYNFKIFDAKLLYDILNKLTDIFDEKHVDCILNILRSVGFGLRKDDPLALKNLILDVQKQAAIASEGSGSNSRIKFLLDIVLAIKNNNVTKIPNYDPSYSEHLKKIMKGFIRKGNYITQLNISLEDLLNADQKGKWWVVGSAWTGNMENKEKKDTVKAADRFSQKLLKLARIQRMNTDSRRDIFCIIMSAEDYLDAFEKLLKLSLKNQQERDIIHVILHCCLQEKTYNPYYSVLAQKFCEYDRKFQMTIKCSVWDKLKTLSEHSGGQISNLAKLLTYLFIEKGLPISTLKIVEFGELDKVSLRFMRQILLGILLHSDFEAVQGVFEKVARSNKLKMFRESLRLFIHHFLLKNLNADTVPEDQSQQLEERAKMVERILVTKEGRLML